MEKWLNVKYLHRAFCLLLFLFPVISYSYEIEFSGFNWKISERENSPGVGRYSRKTVFVDDAGRLHLLLSRSDVGTPQLFAEVRTIEPLHFGTYRIVLSQGWNNLHPNLVFGFFNFPQSNLSMSGSNEIDIELSHWGVPNSKEVQFGLYTADIAKRNSPIQKKFSIDSFCKKLVLTFTWIPTEIKYQLQCGPQELTWNIVDAERGIVPHFPMPLFINLWVFRANRENVVEHEFVVDEFQYLPLGGR